MRCLVIGHRGVLWLCMWLPTEHETCCTRKSILFSQDLSVNETCVLMCHGGIALRDTISPPPREFRDIHTLQE